MNASDRSRDVRISGRSGTARTYVLRDFLERNLVHYEWSEVDPLSDRVPTVTLPGGRELRDPGLGELALALGLTSEVTGGDYDLVVVGGGPAGLACAVYAGCEGLRVVVVEDDAPGGQAGSTARIENYLGFPDGLAGADLAQRALVQAKKFGVEWMLGRAAELRGTGNGWQVRQDDGSMVHGRAVLVATGMGWRKLAVPGAERLVNAGVYYGASVPVAAETAGDDVYVLGAGNSGGQAALFLAGFAKSVTLVVRQAAFSECPMSRYLMDRITADDRITVAEHTEVVNAYGRDRLRELALRDTVSGRVTRVPASSLYVLIGTVPNTEWLAGAAAQDAKGFLLAGTDVLMAGAWPASEHGPLICETSLPGVFVAGDVRAGTIKRIGSAVGQGAVATHAVLEYLRGLGEPRIPRHSTGPHADQFDLLDVDGNGHVERADFGAMAERLVAGFDEPRQSDRARRLRYAYDDFWKALTGVVDRDGDGKITRTEFHAALDELGLGGEVLGSLAGAVLTLADTDGDGAIAQAEFQRLLAFMGFPLTDAGALFRERDADGSGYLDVDELAGTLRALYLGGRSSVP